MAGLICYRYDETEVTVFLKCKPMRHCWRELHLEEERIKLLKSDSSEDFVRYVLNLTSDMALFSLKKIIK